MIDFSKIQLGDVLYHVEIVNSILSRKKIKMTDANGVEWYRYDKPVWLYNIHEIMYVGNVVKICRGNIANIADHQDEYYFQYKSTGNIEYYFECDDYFEDCFHTLEAAQQHVIELKDKDDDHYN